MYIPSEKLHINRFSMDNVYMKKYIKFGKNKKESKILSIFVILIDTCIIMSDMKSVTNNSFGNFLIYNNLKYIT